MAFSVAELANIANAALDYYLNKGTAFQQTLEARPLVKVMEAGKKNFPGGKGDISIAVQGVFGAGGVDDSLVGYTHDDTVAFYTPANIERANYTWREQHIGLSVTHTELKIDGLSVDDGSDVSSHSGRDMTALVNLWENKLFDFGERYARSLNTLLWGDGTSDAKAIAGMQSIITEDPSTGTVGGIDRSVTANRWWMNRARTAAMATAITGDGTLAAYGGDEVTSSAANGGALLQVLQQEMLQLRRYGAMPNKFLCGSDFLAALQVEMRSNGYYTQSGFRGSQDGSMGTMLFDGTPVEYDPELDNLGLSKRGYWWDTRDIFLMTMAGEWRKTHKPARPADQFVLKRSITSTGQLVAKRCNGALVIDIA